MPTIHSCALVKQENTLVFVMNMVSVYCEVEIESLSVIQMYFMPQSVKKGTTNSMSSVEWCAVTFYRVHDFRQKNHITSLRGLCEWGINFGWQDWLIDRTHPIHQSCQHVERHGWPFKANVAFRRSDFNKERKSNCITIRDVFNTFDKWIIWRFKW
jgi:hypothetical protein